MQFIQRIALGWAALASFLLIFLLVGRDSPAPAPAPATTSRPPMMPECARPHGRANQTLFQAIVTEPLEKWIIRAPAALLTSGDEAYALVLLVISAANETAARAEIRRTWAAESESEMLKTGRSLLIFLVGSGSTHVDEEAALYEDVLQVGVEESYRNMVYKIAAGFRWVRESLKAEFVAKIDSDTVVAVDRLYEQLVRVRDEHGTGWIGGHAMENSPPLRNNCTAWYVSTHDFAPRLFPRYVSGPGYAMEWSALERVVGAMGDYEVIEIEDAFFTGIVPAALEGEELPRHCLHHIFSTALYSEQSSCRWGTAPDLAVLVTHSQDGGRNISAAYEALKRPRCVHWWTGDWRIRCQVNH